MRLLLVALALALVAVLALQWRGWPPQRVVAVAESKVPQAEKLDSANHSPFDLLDSPVDKEEYAVVIERPLFLPDRRPPTEEPAEQTDEPQQVTHTDLVRMDLTAVVITTDESRAWVRDSAKQELFKLRLGDDLAGWTVSAIHEDEVELQRQGETDALVLRDYKNHPPPVVKPRRPARKPAGAPAAGEEQSARSPKARRRETPPRPPGRQQRTSTNAQPPQSP